MRRPRETALSVTVSVFSLSADLAMPVQVESTKGNTW